nr:dna polymerase [Quercus suber]
MFIVKTQLPDGSGATYACDPLLWEADVLESGVLHFVEQDQNCGATRSLSPPDLSEFSQGRRAAVFGVNVGGDCSSGTCKPYVSRGLCTLSYDIETAMDQSREGGFALVDSRILSIAAKCSCGDEFYTASRTSDTSTQLVSELISYVSMHGPQWLIGWNCYNFDNECMRYHCDPSLKDIFLVSRIGAFGKPSYGSILNIPGTYNVDVLVYMNRAQYRLRSFRLGDVATSMGVTKKMKMPTMNLGINQEALREYNLNDCVVVMDIWKKEKLEHIIPSIAVCTTSPVYDCSRYVTGTIASHGYSSHAMSLGMKILWTKCSVPQGYQGGFVMNPVRGLHNNVLVCDFSSMYPTIMASCNVNPHKMKVCRGPHGVEVGTVSVSDFETTVWLDNAVVTFDSSSPTIMSSFMTHLITERAKIKKTHPMQALSIKVLGNSVYGSIGYDKSHLYSPLCAACVTAIGRFCITKAVQFFRDGGLMVLYGDTDSCMVSGSGTREQIESHVKGVLDEFHLYLSSTSLRLMNMAVEEFYLKGIMMDKKRYCMLRTDGTVKSVGVSIVRRDVSGLCKEAAQTCVSAVFGGDRQFAIDSISRFVSAVSQMAVQGSLTLKDVSRYVKKDGISGYEYPSNAGHLRFIPEDEAQLSSTVEYDMVRVLSAMSSEIERFTVPCAIGKVSGILGQSMDESWFC